MEDFLGNQYDEGDTIVYAAMSGRSVQLVKAKVLTIHESGTVTVEPMDSARWKQHYGKTRYTDTRTGKTFDPHHPKNREHIERETGVTHVETGEWMSYNNYSDLVRNASMPFDWRHEYRQASVAERAVRNQYKYAPEVWKDYVKVERVAPKVTLKITQNIILIEKASG